MPRGWPSKTVVEVVMREAAEEAVSRQVRVGRRQATSLNAAFNSGQRWPASAVSIATVEEAAGGTQVVFPAKVLQGPRT